MLEHLSRITFRSVSYVHKNHITSYNFRRKFIAPRCVVLNYANICLICEVLIVIPRFGYQKTLPTYPLSTGWVNANELFSQTGVKVIPHTILRNIIKPTYRYRLYVPRIVPIRYLYGIGSITAARRRRRCQGMKISQSIVYTRVYGDRILLFRFR